MDSVITTLGTTQWILDLIQSISTIEVVSKNKILIAAHKRTNYGYLVLEGAFVMQYVHFKNGEERTVSFHLNNYQSYMAPAESFFKGAISMHQIKAVENAKVLQFSSDGFEKLRRENSDFAEYYIQLLKEAVVRQGEMKTKVTIFKPQEFYNDLVKNEPEVIKHFPSKYIAEYMSISREWLSKLRSKY